VGNLILDRLVGRFNLYFKLPIIQKMALITAMFNPEPLTDAGHPKQVDVQNDVGQKEPKPVTADDMRMGNPKAAVTVIEYASLACPHCGAWDREVWPAFKAKYVDTGKVNYVFREFITSPPELAAMGVLVARCAGPGQYFSVIDQVFKAQEQIYTTQDMGPSFKAIAAKVGLSDAQLNACIGDEAALKALNERVNRWVNVEHIRATPTFVVNGTVLEGEQSLAALDAAIAATQAKK
jgi:protein-disulfide isomerase